MVQRTREKIILAGKVVNGGKVSQGPLCNLFNSVWPLNTYFLSFITWWQRWDRFLVLNWKGKNLFLCIFKAWTKEPRKKLPCKKTTQQSNNSDLNNSTLKWSWYDTYVSIENTPAAKAELSSWWWICAVQYVFSRINQMWPHATKHYTLSRI